VNEILGGGEGKITNISIPHGEKGWGDYSYDELVEELGEHYSAEDISSIGDEIIKISEMKPTNIEKFGSQVVKEIDYDGNKLVVWEDYDTFPIDRNIFFRADAPEQISGGRRDFMGQVPGAALAGAGLAGAGIAALGVPAAVKLAGKIGGGITGIPGAAKVAGTAAKAVASKIVVSPAMMALAKGANRYIDSDDVPDDFMSGISDTRDLSFSLGHDFPDSKLGRDIDMGGNDFSSGFVEMEKFLDEKLGDAADFSESIYSVNTKYLDDALYYSEDGNTNEYIGMLKSALKREPISTNEFDGIILKEIDIDGDIAILAEDVEKSKWPRLLFKLKETNLK
jgi:hypothetical protein